VHEASGRAYRDRIAIVQPGWLLQSCALWDRQAEEPFMLELDSSSTTTPPPPPPPTTSASAGLARGGGREEGKEDEGEKVGELKDELVHEIDWGQADRELEEFLEGSESEGGSDFGPAPAADDDDDDDEQRGGLTEAEADDRPTAVDARPVPEAEPPCVALPSLPFADLPFHRG